MRESDQAKDQKIYANKEALKKNPHQNNLVEENHKGMHRHTQLSRVKKSREQNKALDGKYRKKSIYKPADKEPVMKDCMDTQLPVMQKYPRDTSTCNNSMPSSK